MFKSRKKKGFTLIEMVVVIAIIGILAGIIVPNVVDNTKKAKIAADQATARTIVSAITMGQANSDVTLDSAATETKPIPVSVKTDIAPTGINKYLPIVPAIQYKTGYVFAYYVKDSALHIVAYNSTKDATNPVIELYPEYAKTTYEN